MGEPKVLIADDDPAARAVLRFHLEGGGFAVEEAPDGAAAGEMMNESYDVALFDLQMPGATGFECLKLAQTRMPGVPVLMISAYGEVEDAVRAMREGASDYVRKPFEPDELLARLREAVRTRRLEAENRELRSSLGEAGGEFGFVAASEQAKRLIERAERVAPLDTTVLLVGPSGTGKSKLARVIHRLGRGSASKPFISVNCAALPRELIEAELFGHEKGVVLGVAGGRVGKIEHADGGTLFLDDVPDVPLDVQAKLVSVLQDRVVSRIGSAEERRLDVRVIAGANEPLEPLVESGLLREDLYYRLSVVRLEVPPLRERPKDVIALAAAVLQRIAAKRQTAPMRLTQAARERLIAYDWPGNVRELENVLERATVFVEGEIIDAEDLGLEAGPRALGRVRPRSIASATTAPEPRFEATPSARAVGPGPADAWDKSTGPFEPASGAEPERLRARPKAKPMPAGELAAADPADLQAAAGPISSAAAGGYAAASVLRSEAPLAGRSLAEIEKQAIMETLRRCGGNRAKAAEVLGVSEKTIYNKINQYGLKGRV